MTWHNGKLKIKSRISSFLAKSRNTKTTLFRVMPVFIIVNNSLRKCYMYHHDGPSCNIYLKKIDTSSSIRAHLVNRHFVLLVDFWQSRTCAVFVLLRHFECFFRHLPPILSGRPARSPNHFFRPLDLIDYWNTYESKSFLRPSSSKELEFSSESVEKKSSSSSRYSNCCSLASLNSISMKSSPLRASFCFLRAVFATQLKSFNKIQQNEIDIEPAFDPPPPFLFFLFGRTFLYFLPQRPCKIWYSFSMQHIFFSFMIWVVIDENL